MKAFFFLFATLVSFSSHAWQLPESDQLESALTKAFPDIPRRSNSCTTYTAIAVLTCKIDQANSENVECIAEITDQPENSKTKDARLISALKISEIELTKQGEILELACSRTVRVESECPDAEDRVRCFVKTWGGN